MPITSAWKRSRSGLSSTSPYRPGCARSKGRSCAWSARRAWARPHSGSPLPRPPTASLCAWPWAACVTRPKSAATGAPISARCRAGSCKTLINPAPATRCSCSMKSTKWRWISVATRHRRCWKCLIPNKTTSSTTIIWKLTWICRK